jgi:PEP-CTERM motif
MNTPVRRIAALAAAVAATTLTAMPAHAMLVLVAPQDFSGTGLGSVNTVLTLQSPGSDTFEEGSVGRTAGGSSDVISGDALTGTSQTLTRSIGSLGITSASDLRVVLNAVEPGNAGAQGITLTDLVLSIFSPTGEVLFSSGALAAPLVFADTFTGVGNSGWVFALDAAQAAAAQAAAFGANFGANLIGLSASLSGATGGPETFFVASAGGVTAPIPEPQTYALMLAGLGAIGFMMSRRRRRDE